MLMLRIRSRYIAHIEGKVKQEFASASKQAAKRRSYRYIAADCYGTDSGEVMERQPAKGRLGKAGINRKEMVKYQNS